MMRLLNFLRGYVVLEICGASPGWALNCLTEARIAFWDILWIDALTVQIKVFRKKEQAACLQIQSAMCDVKAVERKGAYLIADRFFHRPVLLAMCFVTLMSILVLPCFVFFFEVKGNGTVPKTLILREVEQSDVYIGIFGPKIYPRRIKDQVIASIPKIEWLTIEQHGCRADIVVREREEIPKTETKKGFANIVAAQSGIITAQSVYTGQAQYEVGDTVKKGDILVSGIVDLERTYLIERANAEVFARTWRKIPVCIPTKYMEKTEKLGDKRCLWLVFGGRRIKIFGNSGISYGSCDKMIINKTLTLPLGLTLPVSLEIEEFSFFDETEKRLDKETAEALLSSFAADITEKQMSAGEILNQSYLLREDDSCYFLEATLECHEMIAKVSEAKWNNEDFIND